jgi:serine/threonine-protein kinase
LNPALNAPSAAPKTQESQILESTDLSQILAKQGGGQPPLPVSIKLNYIIQVCRALEDAHNRGIIHGDVKPGNIMVTSEGTVKLENFFAVNLSNAERTAPGIVPSPLLDPVGLMGGFERSVTVIGTLAYMSPEHFRGRTVDVRSDIWAVGVTCYELLAGRRPFLGSQAAELMSNIIMQPTPSLSLAAPGTPPDVIAVVEKALRKDVEQRYQTMAELRIDLEAAQRKMLENDLSRERANQPGKRLDFSSSETS